MRLSEAVIFLTKARLADPRAGQQELDKAERWAELLPDVSLAEAMSALDAHQRESVQTVLPAHIVARVKIARERERRPIEMARQARELTEWRSRKPFSDEERAEADRVYQEALAEARAARQSDTGVDSQA